MEIVDICRFCLKNFIEIENLVKFEINDQIRLQFENVTNTELQTSNFYSKFTCEDCVKNLKFCYQLKKIFTKNQKILHKKYKKKKRSDKRLQKNLENVDVSQNSLDFKEEIKDDNEGDFFSNATVNSNISLSSSNSNSKVTRSAQKESSEETKVICPNCGILVKRENLQHHINIVHLKIKNYVCDICCLEFYSKPRLKGHLLRHFNISTNHKNLNEQQRRDLIYEYRKNNPNLQKSQIIQHFIKLGYQKSTIYNILKRYEMSMQSQRKRGSGKLCGLHDSIKSVQLKQAIKDGVDSYRELGRMFGVDHKTVKKYLDNMGIQLATRRSKKFKT